MPIGRPCRRGRVRRVLVVAAVVCGLVLAACRGDEGAAGGGGPVTIKIGVLPIVDVAPLYLGQKKGFFADENLIVEPRVASGAGEIIPAVVSGDFQLGWANTTSLIVARSKGLPLRIVSRGARTGTSTSGSGVEIHVRKGSPLRSPRDLEGKTISVPALSSVATLTANAALEKQGVDVSTLKYIEIPFPQALSALETGRVDAAYLAEPFSTLGRKAGNLSISDPLVETAPNYITATTFTTEQYIAAHKVVVDGFSRAVTRSFDYASEHPDEIREVLLTYTEIPPEVAQVIRLPDFSAYTETSTLNLTAELAKKYGYIEKEPDISKLLGT